jgi:hypothetical protein
MPYRHHYNINVPVEFDKIKLKDRTQTGHYEKTIPLQTFLFTNKPLIDWLQGLGLTVVYGRYFQSTPGQVYYRHIDIMQRLSDRVIIHQANLVKLNFVFKSKGTKMSWFKLLDGKTGERTKNAHGDPMISYPDDHVVEIYTADVDQHCLIDAGTIHNLTNSYNDGINRVCYSLWLQNLEREKELTWDQATEIFKPYIF